MNKKTMSIHPFVFSSAKVSPFAVSAEVWHRSSAAALKELSMEAWMNPGGKKKSVPTNTTNNKHLHPHCRHYLSGVLALSPECPPENKWKLKG